MSLLPCPECGNPVSTKAVSCPKCGLPFEEPMVRYDRKPVEKSRGLTFWGVVGAVIVAIIIMALE